MSKSMKQKYAQPNKRPRRESADMIKKQDAQVQKKKEEVKEEQNKEMGPQRKDWSLIYNSATKQIDNIMERQSINLNRKEKKKSKNKEKNQIQEH